MMEKSILVIVGPTASGKSALAIKLAKKFGGEIISADSRQVYKGLDVGTGKVTKKEMRGIPHHLLDVVSPKKQFTVSEYKKLADKFVRYIVQKEKLPIVVGGTGFYIDALTQNATFPEVPPNKVLREKLEGKSLEQLFKILQEKDPERARVIDKNNKVRLIRALEIIETLGKVPPVQHVQHRVLDKRFIYIGLRPDEKDLDKRIYTRLIKRLPGIIKEIKKLSKQGISKKRLFDLGLEYRYVSMYVHGDMDKKEMMEKLYTEIRRYAKRQMTWFKRNKKIKWFESAEDTKMEKYLREALFDK